ncbi:uncharacterized protein DMAD_08285 [Drosophila madeirensis]|uniref:Uncharacterized protein n=2 Tax=Drosophila madeirensis TaxID=30013 RepID=A0AAU9F701_DROMD
MSLQQEIREINVSRHIELILRHFRETFRMAAEPFMIGDGPHLREDPWSNVPPQDYRFFYEALNFELEETLAHRNSGSGDAEQSPREINRARIDPLIFYDDIEGQQSELDDHEFEDSEEDDGPLNMGYLSLGPHFLEAQPHFRPHHHVPRRPLLSPRYTLSIEFDGSTCKQIFKTLALMAWQTALRLVYTELYFMS